MKAALIPVLLALSACNFASDDKTVLARSGEASHGADDSDSLGANCPARNVTESQENGSEVWVHGFEGATAVDAASVASDRFGNVYVTRADGGTLKLSPSGEVLWSKPYGSLVAVAADDSVVLAGSFDESITIDDTTLSAAGGSDVYVARLDVDGVLQSAVSLGGSGEDEALGLVTARNGRTIVAATGFGVSALDANGTIVWTRALSGAIGIDPFDNVLVTGALSGSADFGGGELTSAGGRDVFVAKLDADGNHVFSARFGDVGASQEGQAITADFLGNILVTGVFDGSLDFGTGALTPAHCPSEVWCKTSGFVAKFDPNGSALFGLARGPIRSFTGIAADDHGNVIVSGATPGGVPSYRIPLLVMFDAEGEELWERTEWPVSGVGSGRQVAVDPCGDLLWSLSVRPSLDASEHAYVAKLTP